MIQSVRNVRDETIERDHIVTVLEREHEFGTGNVEEIVSGAGRHWALVRWDNGSGVDYCNVNELTNVNVAVRERTLEGS